MSNDTNKTSANAPLSNFSDYDDLLYVFYGYPPSSSGPLQQATTNPRPAICHDQAGFSIPPGPTATAIAASARAPTSSTPLQSPAYLGGSGQIALPIAINASQESRESGTSVGGAMSVSDTASPPGHRKGVDTYPLLPNGLQQCPDCGGFFAYGTIPRHRATHTQAKVPCEYCGKWYSRKDSVVRHQIQHKCGPTASNH